MSRSTVQTGDVLWRPASDARRTTRLGAFLDSLERERGLRFDGYHALWQWSVDDLEGFWGSVAEYFDIFGDQRPATVLASREMPGARWFPGTRLNYAERALAGPDDEIVLVARSQTRAPVEMTRGELRAAVARARAGLERAGVRQGDRVAAYMPNIPEAVIALLASASLGAIWSVCTPEFGMKSVLDRFEQIEPKVLIVVDGYRYGAKAIDRRDAVAEIRAALPTVEQTVYVPYLDDAYAPPDALAWDELLGVEAAPEYAPLPFDAPLWILYSSGTTGPPKAIVHGHGGILIELLKSHVLHSDVGTGDRFFFFCTTGWMVWNSVVSALLTGSSIVLMDGNPAYPDADELWRIAAETQVSTFGCGASFLTAAAKQDAHPAQDFDLGRLRGVISSGSPLPPEGFAFVYDRLGDEVYLQSASGGTDVCTPFVAGSPLLPVHAGEIACPCLGVLAEALDDEGHPVVGELGELVIGAPMPSMPLMFWGDDDGERYRSSYFDRYPGRWRHGDWILFTERGTCVVTGRSDATLNRGGVRLGTSEFYSVVEALPDVVDSMVVHLEDASGGLGRLLLFVQLADGTEMDTDLERRILTALRAQLSPRHAPDEIHAVAAIPRNLTGKKLEVPVKRILQGAEPANVASVGTLALPGSLDAFTAFRARGTT